MFWHGIQMLFLPTAIKGFTEVRKTKHVAKVEKHPFWFFFLRDGTNSLINFQGSHFRVPITQFHLPPLIKPRPSLSTILQSPKWAFSVKANALHIQFNWTKTQDNNNQTHFVKYSMLMLFVHFMPITKRTPDVQKHTHWTDAHTE